MVLQSLWKNDRIEMVCNTTRKTDKFCPEISENVYFSHFSWNISSSTVIKSRRRFFFCWEMFLFILICFKNFILFWFFVRFIFITTLLHSLQRRDVYWYSLLFLYSCFYCCINLSLLLLTILSGFWFCDCVITNGFSFLFSLLTVWLVSGVVFIHKPKSMWWKVDNFFLKILLKYK